MNVNKKYISIIFLIALVLSSCSATGDSPKFIRSPQFAGSFYPRNKKDLEKTLDTFLNNVPSQNISLQIIGLIVPHAGYIYSGPVATYAYQLLIGKQFDTVILLGSSHRASFNGVSIWQKGYWQTPLGKVAINSDLAQAITRENQLFGYPEQPHIPEHSLEVQIPFLQKTLKDFKIVPILLGQISLETCSALAKAIGKNIQNKNVLLIASSDMSHYYSYEQACQMDKLTLNILEKFQIDTLIKNLSQGQCELCGATAVITLLETSKILGADKLQVLKYANSGDTYGDKTRVVGYSACVLGKTIKISATTRKETKMLNEKQKQELLRIARQTIETYLTTGKTPEFNVTDPVLQEKRGVFVTLHEHGDLRGCIGYILPQEPLYKAVTSVAIESATGDPRFSPVTKNELKDIEIEISVLTVPEKINDVSEIVMGKHGVIVRKGFRSGVFLPQVATETAWSKEEFLRNLCAGKAGLSPDAWKDKDTEIYIFSAEVFGESR